MTNKRKIQILRKMLKKFGPKGEYWTQAAYAKAKNGTTTGANDKNAVQWCLAGAMMVVSRGESSCGPVLDELESRLPPRFEHQITRFNDAKSRKFPQVKALILKTIKDLSV